MEAPRRGLPSPPRLELSGSEPSHEPQSRSFNCSEKATPREIATKEAAIAAAAQPGVFIEGMRQEISTGASDGALLQPGMPAEGQAMVAMEKPSTVEVLGERPQEAATTKHPSSRAAAAGWTCAITPGSRTRGSSQGASAKTFLATPAIVRAAMNGSSERGAHRCSDSARMSADVP